MAQEERNSGMRTTKSDMGVLGKCMIVMVVMIHSVVCLNCGAKVGIFYRVSKS